MERFELNTVINRPIEDVFLFLSNLENDLKWRTERVDGRKVSEGPIGMGTQYSLVAKSFGRRIETIYETIKFEPSRNAAWKTLAGPLALTFQRIFEQVDGGTRFTIRYEADVHGFFKLVLSLLASSITRQHADDLRKLKELMETRVL